MEQYIPKIKQIVDEYSSISKELEVLQLRADALELSRKQAMLKLEANRMAERFLIDKIEKETGEAVDFRTILEMIEKDRTITA